MVTDMLRMLVPIAGNITNNKLGNRGVNPNLAQLAALLLPPQPSLFHRSPVIATAQLVSSIQPPPALPCSPFLHNNVHSKHCTQTRQSFVKFSSKL